MCECSRRCFEPRRSVRVFLKHSTENDRSRFRAEGVTNVSRPWAAAKRPFGNVLRRKRYRRRGRTSARDGGPPAPRRDRRPRGAGRSLPADVPSAARRFWARGHTAPLVIGRCPPERLLASRSVASPFANELLRASIVYPPRFLDLRITCLFCFNLIFFF